MAKRKEERYGDVPKIGERFFGAPDRRKSKPEQVTRASFSKTTTSRPDKKEETLGDVPKIGEKFFGAPDRRKSKPEQVIRPSLSKSTTIRPNPDEPVPAVSLTSYKLHEPVRLRMSDKGALAQKPITVMTALQMTVDRYPDKDIFAVKVGGKWQKTKLKDMYRMVRTAAKGFLQLGLTKFHGVGIIGYNAPEWIISYLAAIIAGGVAVGIHYSHPVEVFQRAALSARCNIIVVDSAEDLAKVLKIRNNLPDVNVIVRYGKDEGTPQKIPGVMSWQELLELGEKASEDRLNESIMALAPNHCCIVAFTLGRTGPPKPVMLSHDNVVWTSRLFGRYQSQSTSGGIHISFLPLSQPSGALLDIIVPLIYATTVYFVPRKVLKLKLIEVFREVRPTFIVSTPLFYERIQNRMEQLFEENAVRGSIIKKALNIGRRAFLNAQEGKPRPFGWWFANQLVFKGIKRKLGMDRCLEVHSGKYFLRDSTAEFFGSFGILIVNIYGITEMSGCFSISLPDRYRYGSCGVEMDGCHAKFFPIHGTPYTEIRMKGRNVFMGYLNEPEMTADAFDEGGWYKTTDIGHRDEHGFLYLTGSAAELLQLSDGRLVSPSPMERAVKNQLSCMSHCIACGQKKPYVTMLFTIEAASDVETDVPLDVVSKNAELWLRKRNVRVAAISEMAANPPERLIVIIQSVVDNVNATILDYTTCIRKWKILPRDFSIPTGELNPTYLEKRKFIFEAYATTINSLYDSR